ncbi:MAG TPA: hypothetical protein VMT85_17935 [Thermoanaerobaculia bacterium]|nr:hypothetical protein [Thermoanaerobaculia bacterium]
MTKLVSILVLVLCALGLSGCEDRTDKSEGSVLLSISDFDGLPTQVSVNAADAAGLVTVGQITIQNIPKDPTSPTSSLMNVELSAYEVIFSRADTGTRLPPPLVRQIFGVAPVNGTNVYENLPILTNDQLDAPPLTDLLFINGGFDSETGAQVVSLNLRLRFFGRTLSGDEVETGPFDAFTVDFVP